MKKPNIVFILSDDQGAWALGSAGNKEIITPNLDNLALEGIRFDNFFCVSPVCSPARASILTGNIPSSHGIFDWLADGNVTKQQHPEAIENGVNLGDTHATQFLDGQICYTDLLAKDGYTCAFSGKWHLGDTANMQHGISKMFAIGHGGCNYYNADIIEDGKVSACHDYITDVITDKAIDFIDTLENEDNPFYLSVHYNAPHSPWDEENHPKEIRDLYAHCPFESTPDLPKHKNQILTAPQGHGKDRKRWLTGYYSAITAMDKNIGRIVSTLKQKGILDNTIVIFTADNGMNMGHHGLWGKGNATFPQNMYDSSVKVPFIIRFPKEFGSGTVNNELVSHYDILPTLVDYLLLEDDGLCQKLPGKSFLPLLKNEKTGENTEDGSVVVFDEYGPVRMIRNKTHKYVHVYPYGSHEFYDLVNDPTESINLINSQEHSAQIEKMREALLIWFQKYVNPELDGAKEPVMGYGQYNRGGIYSKGKVVYGQNGYF